MKYGVGGINIDECRVETSDNLNGGATISLNIDFNPLDYGVTLGYNINQQGQPYRYSNVTIYEFSINKL